MFFLFYKNVFLKIQYIFQNPLIQIHGWKLNFKIYLFTYLYFYLLGIWSIGLNRIDKWEKAF